MGERWVMVAACLALLSVAFDAWGTHAMAGQWDEARRNAFQLGVRYQMTHSLAMLIASLMARSTPSRRAIGANWSFLLGVIFFSGGLYAVALFEWRPPFPMTPSGGVAFMLGWVLLAWAGLGRKDDRETRWKSDDGRLRPRPS